MSLDDEVVAVIFASPGRTIASTREDIQRLFQKYEPIGPVTRRRAMYMANADLGPHWEALAKGPTLFTYKRKEEEDPKY